jgi:predicted Zn-dependent peptidase
MADARGYFQTWYAPDNITLAIAGDIRADEARRLADKHFGPIPARSVAPPRQSPEPPQGGPRTVVVENALEPLIAVGFKRPDQYDPDDLVLDVAQMVLGGGRQSMLTKELVDARRIATDVRTSATWPGGRSPHLFTIVVTPAPGRPAEEIDKAVAEAIARLQAEPLDETAVARARAQARAGAAARLTDNASIAALLASYAADHGDWRKLFAAVDAYRKVSPAQVQTAALKYFQPARRTSVLMVPPAPVVRGTAKGAER